MDEGVGAGYMVHRRGKGKKGWVLLEQDGLQGKCAGITPRAAIRFLGSWQEVRRVYGVYIRLKYSYRG